MIYCIPTADEVYLTISGIVDGQVQKIVSLDLKDVEIVLRNRTSKLFTV